MYLEQAKDLRGTVSRFDQHKLDEYLTAVREVEKRLDRATSASQPVSTPKPKMERPADGIPG